MEKVTRKLAKLPVSPGVYFFKNKSGGIIYIGKAGNLKNRVRSYFGAGVRFFNAAKQKMLAEIADIKILKTESEIEALIKESELIKKHKPKFNVLMRDSKNYLFVGFTVDEFPKIILTHQPVSFRNLKPRTRTFGSVRGRLEIRNYVGPFTDGGAVRKSLQVLRSVFPYCTCKQKHAAKCLNAHLGRCLTYCCLKTSTESPDQPQRDNDRYLAVVERYRKNIQAIKSVLSGRSQVLLKELKKEIKQAIKNQNFEEAQRLKHQIISLDEVLKHAHVLTEKPEIQSPAIFKDDQPDFKLLGLKSNPRRIETYDISNIHGREAVGSMVVFELQSNGLYKPNKNEYRKFKIKTVTGINDPAMIAEVISRRLQHREWPLPQLIIVDGGRVQLNAALKILGRKIPVLSLAKKLEEIYLPGRTEPVLAQKFGRAIKHLFQAIRDEAHRFAINYHRRLHRKSTLRA